MRARPKVAGQTREAFDVYALLSRWARWALQLAIAGFVVSAGYILYGIFSGVLNKQVDPAAAERYVRNLRLMGEIMAASGVLGTICFVILTLSEIAYSITMAIVGVALMFGMPILVASNLSQAGNQVIGAINEWSRNAGMGILVVVALRVLYEIVEQIRTAGARRKEKEALEAIEGLQKVKKPPKQGIWSPCWKLPYCHDAVREACPAFKARKSCWRYGAGCNCDPGLIERLIRSGALESGKGASKASSRDKTAHAAYVRSDLQADAPVKAAERTIPCSKCPIYLEHQRQKFKIVNPIAIVATVALMGVAYIPLRAIYHTVVQAIAAVASRMTFDVERVDPGQWVRYLDTPAL
ncbi:MAG: hypothetical protein KKI08_14570, partial [Armatimonadetes bacterium]|nr:hypothetical protein [Armatimonadota bacterium]